MRSAKSLSMHLILALGLAIRIVKKHNKSGILPDENRNLRSTADVPIISLTKNFDY